MDCYDRKAIQNCYTQLSADVDTNYITTYLFERGTIPNESFLSEISNRRKRLEKLISHLRHSCSFQIFVEALRHDGSYWWIADVLEKARILLGRNEGLERRPPIRLKLSEYFKSEERTSVIEFRHALTRLLRDNKIEELDRHILNRSQIWERYRHAKDVNVMEEKRHAADFRIAALDSQAERQIYLFKTSFNQEEARHICDETEQLIKQTSCPIISTIMYQTRVADYELATRTRETKFVSALFYIQTAEQDMEVIPCGRETALVLYTKYLIYAEQSADASERGEAPICNRDELIKICGDVIDHFSHEREEIYKDIKRQMLLKMLQMHLDIKLNWVIDSLNMENVQLGAARNCLRELAFTQLWRRITHNEKMLYFVCCSRQSQIHGNIPGSIYFMKRAIKIARQGELTTQLNIFRGNLNYLNEVLHST